MEIREEILFGFYLNNLSPFLMEWWNISLDYRTVAVNKTMVSPGLIPLCAKMSLRDALPRHLINLEGKKRELSDAVARPLCSQQMVSMEAGPNDIKKLFAVPVIGLWAWKISCSEE